MLNPNIQFKIVRFLKEIGFQILYFSFDFYTKLSAVIPTGQYTASNTLRINITNSSSDISQILTNNTITIGRTNFNLSIATFASEAERDQNFSKIVDGIKELVVYVTNNGTLPRTCHYCFNFFNYDYGDVFCEWITKPSSQWDIDVNYCEKYNVAPPYKRKYEVYEF